MVNKHSEPKNNITNQRSKIHDYNESLYTYSTGKA